jgi:hypothetical protein
MTAALIKDAVVLTMRGGPEDVIRGNVLTRSREIPPYAT